MNIIDLARWYFIVSLFLTGGIILFYIITFIKKRLWRFAFRKHEVWQLQEKYDDLEHKYFILEKLIRTKLNVSQEEIDNL